MGEDNVHLDIRKWQWKKYLKKKKVHIQSGFLSIMLAICLFKKQKQTKRTNKLREAKGLSVQNSFKRWHQELVCDQDISEWVRRICHPWNLQRTNHKPQHPIIPFSVVCQDPGLCLDLSPQYRGHMPSSVCPDHPGAQRTCLDSGKAVETRP